MSPASNNQSEEQQYLEKLKQLSKYIEPLRRMINKIDKNEGEFCYSNNAISRNKHAHIQKSHPTILGNKAELQAPLKDKFIFVGEKQNYKYVFP